MYLKNLKEHCNVVKLKSRTWFKPMKANRFWPFSLGDKVAYLA